MKTEYKILIAALFIIPVTIWLFFLIELVQYENAIAQFENDCQKIREENNHPNADCAWQASSP